MELPADQQGVLVGQVEVGSPADQAGLSGSYKSARIEGQLMPVGGDVITAIDGQAVTSLEDLQAYLQQTKPGQEVSLTVLREGKERTIQVTLAKTGA
jgi:S1-C subfamily serine protease